MRCRVRGCRTASLASSLPNPYLWHTNNEEMGAKDFFIYVAIVVVCGGVNALTYYLLYDSVSRGQWANSFLSGLVVAAIVAWVHQRHKRKMEEWRSRNEDPTTRGGNGR